MTNNNDKNSKPIKNSKEYRGNYTSYENGLKVKHMVEVFEKELSNKQS